MHLLTQNARANRDAYVLDGDKMSSRASPTVEEMFNLGTIQGARAIGMGDQLASSTEGKLADVVIFDAKTPSRICGGQHNPLAAIVVHSSPRDIHTVIIDGKIRKQAGDLLPIEAFVPGANASNEKQHLEWVRCCRKTIAISRRVARQDRQIEHRHGKERINEEVPDFNQQSLRILPSSKLVETMKHLYCGRIARKVPSWSQGTISN